VWSRDGRTLYYLEGTTLKAVPVNTDAAVFDYEPPYELFVMPFPVSTSRFLTSYDVAGDDRFLVVGRPGTEADASARIVVVQNFLEVLRRQVPQP
jgi:hypothetical protein